MPKRKNYSYDYQENILRTMKGRIFAICNDTIEKESEYENLLERMKKEVYKSELWDALTNNRRYFLRGYFDAFISQIHTMIEWEVFHPELGLIKSDEVPLGDWGKIISEKSKFVWRKSKNPYSKSGEEKNGKTKTS